LSGALWKSDFVCQNCGHHNLKWLGKCPACGEWNTLVEEKIQKTRSGFAFNSIPEISKPVSLPDIEEQSQIRIITPDQELNRVLGGGIVNGSLILIGGEPGIGKSTLLLQLALSIKNQKILYVSGEESNGQIKLRASRIGENQSHFGENCLIFTETNLSAIIEQIENLLPNVIIIDSIQTIWSPQIDSSPGSISQVRECTSLLLRVAKSKNIPIFLIGHITKDGTIAGPKVLEHMVDTVLQFEGDRHYTYRILRTLKNRFGSTSELGIYQMHGEGLREVPNPSEILLSNRDETLSGISVSAIMEGARVILLESQALVSSSVYGTPQRSSIGFDYRRMNMLLAVLEKKCGFKLIMQDVFLNITGGIRVEDPAIDLGLAVSLLSSFLDMAIPSKFCFVGEIGLSGEIRSVSKIEQRISEAEKLGFSKIFIPKLGTDLPKLKKRKIQILEISKLNDLADMLFSRG
jgi:DNA repair protein RadA/Sms